MEQVQYIVAIEIGSSKIVGAIADKSSIGLVSVSHLVEEKLINCVRYGCVQNVENVRSAINRIIKELERRIDGRITQTYVGISGRSLHSPTRLAAASTRRVPSPTRPSSASCAKPRAAR